MIESQNPNADRPTPGSDSLVGELIHRNPNLEAALKRFIEVGDLTGQIAQAMRNVSESLKVVDLADFQRRTSNIFQEIGRHFKNTERAQKILDAGWVPYAGMPIDDLPEQATADQVDIFMNSLIGDRWVEVRNCLANTVAMSKVDEEAVVTFDEALSAFENGHYRSVVRVLFPEIERVARDTVYGGSRKDWSIDERKETRRLNTGLGALRESLMQHLPAGLGVYADFGFALTQKMDSHLYRYVESTPEDLAALQADPVPNRHASQHGYVTYSTAQNAYNALSMTAFMFDTILRVDGYLRRKAQVET
ncbi:hypothetical protein [Novosphingobium meiothermophilum]|uniref:hypothetical protein n=1 Tax=Novosphingobium meiothermophilum TaxID=2202251 RepID=UPI0011AB5D6C|nr:hypothetical protein [Novosphingobium meiothermophilum]